MVLVSKVFLARVPGKRVPLRKRMVVQKRAEKEYSWLGMLSLEVEYTNVVEGTHP